MLRRQHLVKLIQHLSLSGLLLTSGLELLAQQAPSVLKQPSVNRGPVNSQQRLPNQPTIATNPGQAPAIPSEATPPEQVPVPANPGQILLKDAADRAKTAQNDGDYSEVIAIATEALKEKPGAAGEVYGRKLLSWAHNRRGQQFSEHGLHPQAVEDFTAALSYDPTLWRALHNRGVSHANAGDKAAALADFNKSLELNRTYGNTWYNRAELFYEQGKFDQAARDFNEALRLSPQDGLSFVGRAKSYARLGKGREAMQDFDAAVRVDPKNPQIRLLRAEAYASIRAHATAVEDYRATIALKPDNGAAYRGLAWIMATCPDPKLRNAEQAVTMAQKAMELDGNNDPRYIETMAAAYANSGQFEAAAELLKHTITSVKPDVAKRWQAHIAVYQAGKPYRDGVEPQPATATRPAPATAGKQPTAGKAKQ